jgi:hypothetical protein
VSSPPATPLSVVAALSPVPGDEPDDQNKSLFKGKRKAVDIPTGDEMDVDDEAGDTEGDDDEEEDKEDGDRTKRKKIKTKTITIPPTDKRLSSLSKTLARRMGKKQDSTQTKLVSSPQVKDHMVIVDLTGDVSLSTP